MGAARHLADLNSKDKMLSRWFPELTRAQAETLDIIMDIEQVSNLLTSLGESRQKQVVAFQEAFGDL